MVKFWSALFLALAIGAAVMGLGAPTDALAIGGKLLFFVFLVLFLVTTVEAAPPRS
jgi:uncharacterized membrane protein YtjA (UPF0391 family)